MIEKLAIKNFKSIKELDIDCRRINLFIGEPNTGKSNILETLGIMSWHGNSAQKVKLNRFLRFEDIQNLFYNGLMNEKIEIIIDKEDQFSTGIEFNFWGDYFNMESKIVEAASAGSGTQIELGLTLHHSGEDVDNYMKKNGKTEPYYQYTLAIEYKKFCFMKYYKFLKQSNFPDNFPDYLLPPNGSNLYTLVLANKKIRELMNILFEGFDLNFMSKADTKTIEPVKQIGNMSIDFPLSTASDTLNQIIFFYSAMESNKNSTLVFDNPLASASPDYAKHFGERIAFDNSNQYFISTHNLYLLTAILEKTSRDSVNLFITYLKDYNTRVRKLKNEEISILLDSDPFFNVNYFLEED